MAKKEDRRSTGSARTVKDRKKETPSETSVRDVTENRKNSPRLTSSQWWRAKEHNQKPHEILENLFSQIEQDQQGRYEAYKEYERLAGSSVGPNGDNSYRAVSSQEVEQNELQNTLETLWAQIYKNKIVPAVSVNEAEWDEWDRAKGLSRWLEGAFDEAEVHESVMPKAGWGQLVHGTGIVKVGWEEVDKGEARICAWPINARYVFVDRMEAKHGKPRSFYQKDHYDRFVLYDMYSEDSDEFYGTAQERMDGIMDAKANDDIDLGASNTSRCDMITVKEVWRLPSSRNSKDGKHCIWINGCTLVYEDFDWDTFPFVFIPYGAITEGFWGESPVKRLAPMQRQLDKLIKKIDEAQDVMGVARILIRKDANIRKADIDDLPGIIEADDISENAIKDWNAQAGSPELYQTVDALPRKMRGLVGVSDFEAQSQLPNGLRDVGAPFLERWIDQGAARHAMDHGHYENAIVKLAELFIRQAEDCQKMGYKVTVRGPADSHTKTSIESLDFKDVGIDRKKMKLRVQPMSQIPQTFAGKVDAIQKLKESGLSINPQAAARMTEVPDLFGVTDMLVSDEEIIYKNLCHMCKTGEYLPPMPMDNLKLIIAMTTRYINHYRVRNDADNAVVGLLAQYIDDAIALQNGLGGTNPDAPPPIQSTVQALGMGPPGMPPGMVPPGMPPGMAPPPGLPPGPMGPPPPMGPPAMPPAPPGVGGPPMV